MATIKIKAINGEDTVVEGVNLEGTVAAFKELVKTKTGVDVPHQRIIFGGRVLKDGDTLSAADVKDGSQVHLVSMSRAAAPPAAAPAPAQPRANLFTQGGQQRPSGVGAGAGINPAALMANPEAFMRTPEGQQIIQEITANPERFLAMIPPEARNSPHVQALLRNPQALQQLLAGGAPGMGMGMRAGPLVPRDVFDTAMDVMNGAPLPAEYARMAGGAANDNANAAQDGPGQETISRAQINAALDQCVTAGLINASAAAPAPAAPGPAAAVADDAVSDAATAGSAVGDAMDVGDESPVAEPSGANPADVESPATRFAAQLAQMRAMGFDNDAQCLQALEMTGGDVDNAVAILFQ